MSHPVVMALYESGGYIRVFSENSGSYENTAKTASYRLMSGNRAIMAMCAEDDIDTVAKALAKKHKLKYEKK